MRKWLPLLLVIVATCLSAFFYRAMPPQVNLDFSALLPVAIGAVDTAPRFVVAFGVPGLALLLCLLMHEAPVSRLGRAAYAVFPFTNATRLSAADYQKFAPSYRQVVLWIVCLMLALHAVVVMSALSHPNHAGRLFGIVFGVGLLAVGNIFPRLRPNSVAGIRTERTMNNPQLWRTVHKTYGAMWLVSGFLVVIVSIIAPSYALATGLAAVLLSTLAMLFVPAV